MSTTMATTPLLIRTTIPAPPTLTQIACENVRLVCIYRGARRKDLADILRSSYHTASRIWNGRGDLSLEQLNRVAKALSVPVDRFMVTHGDRWDWIYR